MLERMPKCLNSLVLVAGLVLSLTLRAEEVRYVDAASLEIIGKPLPTEKPFVRIDGFDFHAKGINAKCTHSTGLAVLFRTNSTVMRAPFTHHEGILVADMAPGMKECLLYLPLYDRVDSRQVGIDTDAVIEPMENPFTHRILFEGSSITHGASASRPGMCYTGLLEMKYGWYCMNMGFSGESKLQPEIARYLTGVEADVYIFDAFSNPSAQEIDDRFDTFVDILREAHPRAPLVFLQIERRETRTVTFTLTPEDLSFWRKDMTFGPEPGAFRVFVGPDASVREYETFVLIQS